jgi:hypothetical protein
VSTLQWVTQGDKSVERFVEIQIQSLQRLKQINRFAASKPRVYKPKKRFIALKKIMFAEKEEKAQVGSHPLSPLFCTG